MIVQSKNLYIEGSTSVFKNIWADCIVNIDVCDENDNEEDVRVDEGRLMAKQLGTQAKFRARAQSGLSAKKTRVTLPIQALTPPEVVCPRTG
ncbi:hypothetical protein KM043_015544 [Ampulex compressa]|nr:hypothetical protein KM043_015544 [Ampulex compressa]